MGQPILQLVPSQYIGTVFEPPPATTEANVVAVASETKDLTPAFVDVALGSVETVNTVGVFATPLTAVATNSPEPSWLIIVFIWLKYRRSTFEYCS